MSANRRTVMLFNQYSGGATGGLRIADELYIDHQGKLRIHPENMKNRMNISSASNMVNEDHAVTLSNSGYYDVSVGEGLVNSQGSISINPGDKENTGIIVNDDGEISLNPELNQIKSMSQPLRLDASSNIVLDLSEGLKVNKQGELEMSTRYLEQFDNLVGASDPLIVDSSNNVVLNYSRGLQTNSQEELEIKPQDLIDSNNVVNLTNDNLDVRRGDGLTNLNGQLTIDANNLFSFSNQGKLKLNTQLPLYNNSGKLDLHIAHGLHLDPDDYLAVDLDQLVDSDHSIYNSDGVFDVRIGQGLTTDINSDIMIDRQAPLSFDSSGQLQLDIGQGLTLVNDNLSVLASEIVDASHAVISDENGILDVNVGKGLNNTTGEIAVELDELVDSNYPVINNSGFFDLNLGNGLSNQSGQLLLSTSNLFDISSGSLDLNYNLPLYNNSGNLDLQIAKGLGFDTNDYLEVDLNELVDETTRAVINDSGFLDVSVGNGLTNSGGSISVNLDDLVSPDYPVQVTNNFLDLSLGRGLQTTSNGELEFEPEFPFFYDGDFLNISTSQGITQDSSGLVLDVVNPFSFNADDKLQLDTDSTLEVNSGRLRVNPTKFITGVLEEDGNNNIQLSFNDPFQNNSGSLDLNLGDGLTISSSQLKLDTAQYFQFTNATLELVSGKGITLTNNDLSLDLANPFSFNGQDQLQLDFDPTLEINSGNLRVNPTNFISGVLEEDGANNIQLAFNSPLINNSGSLDLDISSGLKVDQEQLTLDIEPYFQYNSGSLGLISGKGITLAGNDISIDSVEPFIFTGGQLDLNIGNGILVDSSQLTLDVDQYFEFNNGVLGLVSGDGITLANNNLAVNATNPFTFTGGQLDLKTDDSLELSSGNLRVNPSGMISGTVLTDVGSGDMSVDLTLPLYDAGAGNGLDIYLGSGIKKDTALTNNNLALDVANPFSFNNTDQLQLDFNNPFYLNNGSLDLALDNGLQVTSGNLAVKTTNPFSFDAQNQLQLDFDSTLEINSGNLRVNPTNFITGVLEEDGANNIQLAFNNPFTNNSGSLDLNIDDSLELDSNNDLRVNPSGMISGTVLTDAGSGNMSVDLTLPFYDAGSGNGLDIYLGSGLKKDTTMINNNLALDVAEPFSFNQSDQLQLDFDSTLEIDASGLKVNPANFITGVLEEDSDNNIQLAFNDPFYNNSGNLDLNLGDGLEVLSNQLTLDVAQHFQFNTGTLGLVVGDGVTLANNDVALDYLDPFTITNGQLDINLGDGIQLSGGNLAMDVANPFSFNGSGQLQLDTDTTLEINGSNQLRVNPTNFITGVLEEDGANNIQLAFNNPFTNNSGSLGLKTDDSLELNSGNLRVNPSGMISGTVLKDAGSGDMSVDLTLPLYDAGSGNGLDIYLGKGLKKDTAQTNNDLTLDVAQHFEYNTGTLSLVVGDGVTLANNDVALDYVDPFTITNGQLDINLGDGIQVSGSDLAMDVANPFSFNGSGQLQLDTDTTLEVNASNQLRVNPANFITGVLEEDGANNIQLAFNNPFTNNSGSLDLNTDDSLELNSGNLRVNPSGMISGTILKDAGSGDMSLDLTLPFYDAGSGNGLDIHLGSGIKKDTTLTNDDLTLDIANPFSFNNSEQLQLNFNNPLYLNSDSLDLSISNGLQVDSGDLALDVVEPFSFNDQKQLQLDTDSTIEIDSSGLRVNPANFITGVLQEDSNNNIQLVFNSPFYNNSGSLDLNLGNGLAVITSQLTLDVAQYFEFNSGTLSLVAGDGVTLANNDVALDYTDPFTISNGQLDINTGDGIQVSGTDLALDYLNPFTITNGQLDINLGNGIQISGGDLAMDVTNPFSFNDLSQLQLDTDTTLEINGSNQLRVNPVNFITGVLEEDGANNIQLAFNDPFYNNSGNLDLNLGNGLNVSSSQLTLDVASHFQFNTGTLGIVSGDGITLANNDVALDYTGPFTISNGQLDINRGDGIQVSGSNLALDYTDPFTITNGKLDINTGNGIQVSGINLAMDVTNPFSFNGLNQLQLDSDDTLDVDGTGQLRVNPTNFIVGVLQEDGANNIQLSFNDPFYNNTGTLDLSTDDSLELNSGNLRVNPRGMISGSVLKDAGSGNMSVNLVSPFYDSGSGLDIHLGKGIKKNTSVTNKDLTLNIASPFSFNGSSQLQLDTDTTLEINGSNQLRVNPTNFITGVLEEDGNNNIQLAFNDPFYNNSGSLELNLDDSLELNSDSLRVNPSGMISGSVLTDVGSGDMSVNLVLPFYDSGSGLDIYLGNGIKKDTGLANNDLTLDVANPFSFNESGQLEMDFDSTLEVDASALRVNPASFITGVLEEDEDNNIKLAFNDPFYNNSGSLDLNLDDSLELNSDSLRVNPSGMISGSVLTDAGSGDMSVNLVLPLHDSGSGLDIYLGNGIKKDTGLTNNDLTLDVANPFSFNASNQLQLDTDATLEINSGSLRVNPTNFITGVLEEDANNNIQLAFNDPFYNNSGNLDLNLGNGLNVLSNQLTLDVASHFQYDSGSLSIISGDGITTSGNDISLDVAYPFYFNDSGQLEIDSSGLKVNPTNFITGVLEEDGNNNIQLAFNDPFYNNSGNLDLNLGDGLNVSSSQLTLDVASHFQFTTGTLSLVAGNGVTLANNDVALDYLDPFTVTNGQLDINLGNGLQVSGSNLAMDVTNPFSFNGSSQLQLDTDTTLEINGSNQLRVNPTNFITGVLEEDTNNNIQLSFNNPFYNNSGSLDLNLGDGLNVSSSQLTLDVAQHFQFNTGTLNLVAGDGVTLANNDVALDVASHFQFNTGTLSLVSGNGITLANNDVALNYIDPFTVTNGQLDINLGDGLQVSGSNLAMDVTNPFSFNASNQLQLDTDTTLEINGSNQLRVNPTNFITGVLEEDTNNNIQLAFNNPFYNNSGSLDLNTDDSLELNSGNLRVNPSGMISGSVLTDTGSGDMSVNLVLPFYDSGSGLDIYLGNGIKKDTSLTNNDLTLDVANPFSFNASNQLQLDTDATLEINSGSLRVNPTNFITGVLEEDGANNIQLAFNDPFYNNSGNLDLNLGDGLNVSSSKLTLDIASHFQFNTGTLSLVAGDGVTLANNDVALDYLDPFTVTNGQLDINLGNGIQVSGSNLAMDVTNPFSFNASNQLQLDTDTTLEINGSNQLRVNPTNFITGVLEEDGANNIQLAFNNPFYNNSGSLDLNTDDSLELNSGNLRVNPSGMISGSVLTDAGSGDMSVNLVLPFYDSGSGLDIYLGNGIKKDTSLTNNDLTLDVANPFSFNASSQLQLDTDATLEINSGSLRVNPINFITGVLEEDANNNIQLAFNNPFYNNSGSLDLNLGDGLNVSSSQLTLDVASHFQYDSGSLSIISGDGITTSGNDISLDVAYPFYFNDSNQLEIDSSGLQVNPTNFITGVLEDDGNNNIQLAFNDPFYNNSGSLDLNLGDGLNVLSSQLTIDVASHFQFNTGTLNLVAGDGVTLANNDVALDVASHFQFTTGTLSLVSGNGVTLANNDVALDYIDPFTVTNGQLDINLGNGLQVSGSNLAMDVANPFSFNGSSQLQLDTDTTLEINGSNQLRVNPTNFITGVLEEDGANNIQLSYNNPFTNNSGSLDLNLDDSLELNSGNLRVNPSGMISGSVLTDAGSGDMSVNLVLPLHDSGSGLDIYLGNGIKKDTGLTNNDLTLDVANPFSFNASNQLQLDTDTTLEINSGSLRVNPTNFITGVLEEDANNNIQLAFNNPFYNNSGSLDLNLGDGLNVSSSKLTLDIASHFQFNTGTLSLVAGDGITLANNDVALDYLDPFTITNGQLDINLGDGIQVSGSNLAMDVANPFSFNGSSQLQLDTDTTLEINGSNQLRVNPTNFITGVLEEDGANNIQLAYNNPFTNNSGSLDLNLDDSLELNSGNLRVNPSGMISGSVLTDAGSGDMSVNLVLPLHDSGSGLDIYLGNGIKKDTSLTNNDLTLDVANPFSFNASSQLQLDTDSTLEIHNGKLRTNNITEHRYFLSTQRAEAYFDFDQEFNSQEIKNRITSGQNLDIKGVNPELSLRDNIRAYYSFDDSSEPFKDDVGVYDGINNGVVTTSDGKIGKALEFQLGDYVDIPSAFDFGTGDFTISFWFYPTTTSTNPNNGNTVQHLLRSQTGGSTPRTEMSFNANGNRELRFKSWDSTSNGVLFSQTSLTINQWRFLTFTRQGAQYKIFIDGRQDNSGTVLSGDVTGPDCSISDQRGTSGGGIFNDGRLDELGIWNRVLSDDEILALYNQRPSGYYQELTSDMRAYYTFDNSSSPYRDELNNYDGTMVSANDTIESTPFHQGLRISTASDYLDIGEALKVGSSDFTWACWYYPRANASQVIMSSATSIIDPRAVFIFENGGSGIRVYTRESDFNFTQLTAITDNPINQWYHLVFTRSGSTGKIFINGVKEADGDVASGDLGNHNSTSIGRDADSLQDGTIDEVGVWFKELTESEVIQLYTERAEAYQDFINQRNLTNQLRAYYAFEGDFTDSLGNYNGTNNGGTIIEQGKKSKGVEFTADNQFINIGQALKVGSGDFTISFWFYPKQQPDSDYDILCATDESGDGNRAIFTFESDQTVRFFSSDGSTNVNLTSITTLSLDAWNLVTFTRTVADAQIYIDGTLDIEGQVLSGNIASSNSTYISLDSTRSLRGIIDEFAVWTRVLPDDEIKDLYNSGSGLTFEELKQWQFLQTSNGLRVNAFSQIEDSYLEYQQNASYLTDYSVSLWLKPINFFSYIHNNPCYLLFIGDSTANSLQTQDAFIQYNHETDQIAINQNNSSTTADFTLNLDQWYHFVLTRDTGNDNQTLFIDNQKVLEVSGLGSADVGDTIRIGGGFTDSNGKIHGTLEAYVDQTAVFSQVLSESQISTLYNQGTGMEIESDIVKLAGNGTSSHVMIASKDAPQRFKDQADYICSGNNDHHQINQGFNDLSSQGGLVELSAGTFTISDLGGVKPPSKCRLMGQGTGSTIIKQDSSLASSTTLVDLQNNSNITIENLELSDDSATTIGISMGTSATRHRLHNLSFKGPNTRGINLSGSGHFVKECNFSNCQRGIQLDSNCQEVTVSGIQMDSGSKGVEINGSSNILVSNFIFTSMTSSAVTLTGTVDTIQILNGVDRGNTLDNSSLGIFEINADGQKLTISQVQVVNPTGTSSPAFRFVPASAGNPVLESQLEGLKTYQLNSGASALVMTDYKNTIISNCLFNVNSTNTSNRISLTGGSSDLITLIGCHVHTSSGTASGGNDLELKGSSVRYTVSNCNLTANGSTDLGGDIDVLLSNNRGTGI